MSIKSAGAGAPRIMWLDAARGLGIFLVVLGHALGGLIDSPAGAHFVPFRWLFLGIYTFHMPLFFLLAGLFVEPRLARGPGHFIRSILPTVVWPYFLWSTVQLVIIYATGSLANRPVESLLPGLSNLAWKPVSQFWFLYALFGLHLASSLLLRRTGREGFLLLALAAKALVLIVPMPFALRLVCIHGFFYAVGVWLGAGGLEILIRRYSAVLRIAVLPLLALAIILLTLAAAARYAPDINILIADSPHISNVAWRFPAMAAAISAVVAVLGLSMLTPVSQARWLGHVGRRTMPIFLLHVMFVAGTRIILVHLGLVSHLWLVVVLLVAAGIAGPLVVAQIAARLRTTRLLGFG